MNNIFSSKLMLPFSVAAIILVAGGVFAWSQINQTPAPQPTPTPSPTPSPIPVPAPQPAPAPQPISVPEIPDDWQTYHSEEYGFEFQYPSGWIVDKVYYGSAAQQIRGEKEIIGVKIFPQSQQNKNDFIAIGGHQISCADEPPHTKCQYLENVANFIYTDSDNSELLEVFDQILATFRFIQGKYMSVELKEVLSYSSVSENNYVQTSGEIVGLEYDAIGGTILLSDDSNNYLLVTICHACVSNYFDLLSTLKNGDQIEVKGIAHSTVPKDSNLQNKFDIVQTLPEKIGMIGLEFTDGIRIINN